MADLLPLVLRLLQLYHMSHSTRLVIVPLDVLLAELLAGQLPDAELRAALQPFHEPEASGELALLRDLAALLARLPNPAALPTKRIAALSRACDTLLAVAAAGRDTLAHLALPLADMELLRLVQELRIDPPEQGPAVPVILVGGPFTQEVTIELRGERRIERQSEIIYGERTPFPQINTSHLEIRHTRARQNLRKPVIQRPGPGNTLELYSNKERKVGSIQTVEEAPRTLSGRSLTLSFHADIRATLLVTSIHDDRAVLLSQVVRVVGQA